MVRSQFVKTLELLEFAAYHLETYLDFSLNEDALVQGLVEDGLLLQHCKLQGSVGPIYMSLHCNFKMGPHRSLLLGWWLF